MCEGEGRGNGGALTMWHEYKLWSLNSQMKMRTKMMVKMTIFAESRIRFDFQKMIIFGIILISFSSSFLKNEIQNDIKMSQKWPKNANRE